MMRKIQRCAPWLILLVCTCHPWMAHADTALDSWRGEVTGAQRRAANAAAAGNYRRAYDLANQAVGIAVRGVSEKIRPHVLDLAQPYESEIKRREIEELTRRNQLQMAEISVREFQQRWLWTVLVGSILALAGTAYFVFWLRRSQRLLGAANAQLQHSQEEMRQLAGVQQSILDALPAWIVLVNHSGDILAANRKLDSYLADNQLGVPHTDATLNFFDLLPLSKGVDMCDVDSVIEGTRAILAGTRSRYAHQFPLHGEDQEFWFLVRALPLPTTSGPGALVIYQDFTETRRAETLIHAREQEFRALAENSPDIIVRYDHTGRRVYVNPTLTKLAGRTQQELLSRTPIETGATDPAGAQAIHEAVMMVLETGKPTDIEVVWRDNDGATLWHYIRFVPEFDRGGQITSVLGIGRDIAELKKNEQRLNELSTMLRELLAHQESALEEQRKLLSREVHDELGQLLSVLRWQVMTGSAVNGEQHVIDTNLLDLVDQTILAVRNIAAMLRPAVLDTGIVAALEWLVQEFSEKSGLECKFFTAGTDIRMSDEQATAVFRIAQQALTNVVQHAEASRVDLWLETVDRRHVLRVIDNGIGIDPKRPRERKSFGLLGMEERALMIGGELTVTSSPIQGTLVKLVVPSMEQGGTA